MDRVKVTEVEGLALQGYRFMDAQLVLDLVEGREALLECRCGRTHWIVVTRGGAGGQLEVVCHACRTRATMSLALPRGPP